MADAIPDFKGFNPDLPRSEQVRQHLVNLIRSLRQRRPVPFYSMPDIARFFGVSVTTVARLYADLEAEGLLQRKRGSMTLISARQSAPRAHLRGVVVTPIWIPGFLRFAEHRFFHRELDGQLRRHRFVSNALFHHQGEECLPDFIGRILDHQPDTVVWLSPAPADMETVCSIREKGIRVIAVENEPLPTKQAYQIHRSHAIEQGLRAWHRDGIRMVVVPGLEVESGANGPLLREIATRVGLRIRFTNPPSGTYREDFSRIVDTPNTGVLFENECWFHWLCRYQTRELIQLIQRNRTIVTVSFDILDTDLAGLFVDHIRLPWSQIATRIADDLGADKHPTPRNPAVFEASWHPHVPATELSGHLMRE